MVYGTPEPKAQTSIISTHANGGQSPTYGNTRTTAVFSIKYLRSLGFNVNNDIFAENSWYFRNALVRANYNNLQKGIQENPEFLERFFRNLLMGEHNELKNRYCHIRYTEQVAINSEKSSDKVAIKRKSSDIILDYLRQNDSIDNLKGREITGLSAAGVRKIFNKLESLGIIAGFGEKKGRRYKLKEKNEQSFNTIFQCQGKNRA